jgi:hypothetical protein
MVNDGSLVELPGFDDDALGPARELAPKPPP